MDKIVSGLIDWIKEIIQETVDTLVQQRLNELEGRLLTQKEVAEKLGMNVKTFKEYQRDYEAQGFPKELPGKRWKYLAVINWLAENN